ncbi:MAG: hypothetical protein KJT01_01110 [Gemmatimonadetes bacterium]|nr:hypothetical protein [Gemmatimonadota bacterium]
MAALLRIYPDPDALREVARIIRGWTGEEPRALWERLRAERRARGAARGTVEKVAGWMVSADWAYRQGNPDSGFNPSTATGRSAGCDTFADRADRLANSAISAPVRVSPCIPTAAEVAATIGTPGDLSGCIIYMDPPYAGTTGYTADLPRAEVVAHARDFADLGATVAISEAEAIPDLVRSGWHSVEITGGRVGAKRTFSKQQREIITMNKPPQYTVPTQSSLFP